MPGNRNGRHRIRALLATGAAVTPLTTTIQGVATHPEDHVVLAAAGSGKVDFLQDVLKALAERQRQSIQRSAWVERQCPLF